MDRATDRSRPPSRQLLWLERRGIWELQAFFAAYPLLRRASRGDGHPVLVLPGLATRDASKRPVRGAASRRSVRNSIAFLLSLSNQKYMETSKQSTGTDDTSTQLLDDIKKLTEKLKLPGIDVAALVDWQRKDLETLVEANRQAYEGVRALIERRNEMLKERLEQWQATVKDATSSEAIAKQAEAGKQGVQQVIANIRELAEMEAQSRNNAWKVVQDRMQENLADLQKLLQPK